jgi:hypothetical protein
MAVVSGGIQAEGLREAIRDAKALGLDTKGFNEANYEAAVTLIAAARPLVPVRSGRLLATLKPAKTKTYAAARAGTTKVPYAGPIHWGWAIVGASHKGKLTAGGPRSYRNIAPQPFFAKALGYTYEEILKNYDNAMKRLIVKHNLGDN